jgi:hypothetical protein
MIKKSTLLRASTLTFLGAIFSVACGGTGTLSDDQNMPGGGDDSDGKPNNGSNNGPSNGNTNDGRQLIPVTPIIGGGTTAGPLKPGCGPETADECAPPGGGCNDSGFLNGEVEVIDAGAQCFFDGITEVPSATVEYITEVNQGSEYVHVRVTFDPDFVDTVYGECALQTGWAKDTAEMPMSGKPGKAPKEGHTFKDLVGSDHVELMLFDCQDDLSMHMKVDFISEDAEKECGYGTLGVVGGEGEMIVGQASDVIRVSSSMDRNVNGCGYCLTEESPCPADPATYSNSTEAPEWDFRMVYELWIRREAFGSAGFCKADIDFVHASPSKASENTIIVEPGDCPPPPGGDCPVNFELFLSSEGQYICVGPPNEGGDCPAGYTFDLTSEGELCVPE